MTLILAEILVKCPKQNLKVNVKEQCLSEPRCEHAKHFAFVGDKVYFVCSYGEPDKSKENILWR